MAVVLVYMVRKKRSALAQFLLSVEFVLLFFGSPFLVVYGILPKYPVPVLVAVSSCMLVYLLRDRNFHRRRLFHFKALRSHLRPVLIQFFILSSLMSLSMYFFMPELLFELPKRSMLLWSVIVLGYPLLSVYPQEIIYRAFIFHRYSDIFPGETAIVLASSVAFGFVHIVFGSWLSVALSFVGGLLFSSTYAKSRSLFLVTIEHSLFGIFIFTIGLGRYFYLGTF